MTITNKLAVAAFAAVVAAGTGSAFAQGKALGACSNAKADACKGSAATAKADKLDTSISPTVSSGKQSVLQAAPQPAAGQAVDGAAAK